MNLTWIYTRRLAGLPPHTVDLKEFARLGKFRVHPKKEIRCVCWPSPGTWMEELLSHDHQMTKPIKWSTSYISTNSLLFGLVFRVQVLMCIICNILQIYSCSISGSWAILGWMSLLDEIYLIRYVYDPASRKNLWYLHFLNIDSLYYFYSI